MTDRLVITNCRAVLSDRVLAATIWCDAGRITRIEEGKIGLTEAIDLDGDYLLPGLVELHTDNMEKHFSPRPGVRWPSVPAVLAHDAQIAAAGITTVLDAVAVGDVRDGATRAHVLREMLDAVIAARRFDALRADHLMHLRCEVSFPDLVPLIEPMLGLEEIRLVSVMDHTPGQRQFASLVKYREYYQGKFGMNDTEMTDFMDQQAEWARRHSAVNRQAIVALCRAGGIPLASHDDATPAHVETAVADGMVIAEFPTTVEAARLSRAAGMKVLMGAPNLVRGGSHSGNVAARDLALQDMLDIVSSDYVPASLLPAAFRLHHELNIDLPSAVATVTLNPATSIGLDDRGSIAVGRRADLVRVRDIDGLPIVRAVWREGRRVC